MTRIMKLTLVCALIVGALASTAHAAVWNTNGAAAPGVPFTATSPGPATTNYANGAVVTCPNATLSGNLLGPTVATGAAAGDITLAYAGCTFAGFPATKTCTAGNFTPDGYDTHMGAWNPGTTNGYTIVRLTVACTLTISSQDSTTFEDGQLVVAYGNPALSTANGPTNPIGAQIGQRSFLILGSDMSVTSSGSMNPIAPVGTAVQYNAPPYVVTSAFVPNIVWA